jgi:hypothetical protein
MEQSQLRIPELFAPCGVRKAGPAAYWAICA